MNYLIINGSPRRENTWKIVERIKDTLSNLDDSISFNEIDLIDEEIPSCVGCYNCFNTGETTCPHTDKIQPIVKQIKNCDAHASFIVNNGDLKALKNLKIRLTCEPNFKNHNLYND